jgi:hypothetical protein
VRDDDLTIELREQRAGVATIVVKGQTSSVGTVMATFNASID